MRGISTNVSFVPPKDKPEPKKPRTEPGTNTAEQHPTSAVTWYNECQKEGCGARVPRGGKSRYPYCSRCRKVD